MLKQLVLNNFPSGYNPEINEANAPFILKTCQRTVVLSYGNPPRNIPEICEVQNGKLAYQFLLETICGLKSKLIAENEIVGQFKNAYKNFVDNDSKQSELIPILEKLFKDAKEIRSKYLLGISQKTYASIARKHLVRSGAPNILIVKFI
jgi:glutamyl-tRNA reductase